MAPIVIGTRATPLARIQADLVARRLGELGVHTAIRAMSSQGDRSLGGSFAQSKGVFTGELTAALRDGSVDLVVHSLKDLPVEDEPDLVIVAVPERERPFDLLLFAPDLRTVADGAASEAAPELATLLDAGDDAAGRNVAAAADAFAPLPPGARLGTSSPRRQAGALAIRPDLVCCAVRGSVGRRLEWLQSGAIDALLAAEAGVLRLARSDELDAPGAAIRGYRLDLRSWPCAPGQGALAVQILRGGRLDGHPAMAALDDAPSRAAAFAERSLLGRLGGGCLRPFGAWADARAARGAGPALHEVHALIAADDWREPAGVGEAPTTVRAAASAADGPVDLDAVAGRIERDLGEVAPDPAAGAPSVGLPDLIVTSGPATVRRLTRRLDPAVRVAPLPATAVEVFDTAWPADRIDLNGPRRQWPWLLVSSPTAARVVAERAVREPAWGRLPWCALGEGTARALLTAGVPPNLAARASGGEEFARYAARVLDPHCPLFVPHSARGGTSLVEALEAAGRQVTAWQAYTVHPNDDLDWPQGWQAAHARVLFTAPSAVSAFVASGLDWPGSCWAIGAATAAALRSAGAGNVKCAQEPTAAGIERLWLDEVGAQPKANRDPRENG
ncbi:MAG: uroporphyrinogen-III synthase [Acidobacteriota bacterium]|nr:uroporphyrinogen-III synthase [Acidobacteriota bacterium]MDE3264816.1 uroporphyrinogen-III synthase [Acidobacteriota bacterium]